MFYTYLWLREDGTPYYVGKGKGNRSHQGGERHSVNRPVEFERIIIQDCSTEVDAFEVEKFLITYYGRLDLGTGCLRNRTDGGEGAAGAIRSEATRNKLSRAIKGHLVSDETRRKISDTLVRRPVKYWSGKERSEDTRRKISESLTGKTRSEETRHKISESLKRRGVTRGHNNNSSESI